MDFSRLIFFLILITIAAFASAAARAHDPGFSTAVVTVSEGEIEAVVTYARNEFDALGTLDTGVSPTFQIGDRRPRESAPELNAEGDAVIRLTTPRHRENAVIFANPLLHRLPAGHRQLLLVRDPEHAMLLQQYLHRGSPSASLDLSKFPELVIKTPSRSTLLAVEAVVCATLSLIVIFVFRRSPPLNVTTPPER